MTKPIRTVFKAADGSGHLSNEAAEERNQLLEAAELFQKASDRVTQCLGAAALTADGEPFNVKHSRDYWYVHETFHAMPRLAKIFVWPHNAIIDSSSKDGALSIRWHRAEDRFGELRLESYPIAKLYAHKCNAQLAHVRACKEFVRRVIAAAREIELDYRSAGLSEGEMTSGSVTA